MNNRLQERRLAMELTQPQVSQKLKEIDPRMDVGMVSRFERGACLPTLPVLEALERILQATRTELFDEDELGAIPGSAAQGGKMGPLQEPSASGSCGERTSSGASDTCLGDGLSDTELARTTSPMTVALSGLIPFGRREAISREALAAKLGMSDRAMRKAVEDARAEGLIIICEQNGRGYYQSSDLAEMRYQYQQDTNRAMSILKRRKPLRDALRAAGQQV